MNIKLQITFFILAGILLVINLYWLFATEKRLKRFFLGKNAKDLESTIVAMQDEISKLHKSRMEVEKNLEIINQKLKKSIRGLETIRFNPFPDQGSNQSFAIGLLNEDGDGVVLSSLYSRERMSVFAKPVKNSKSEYELTEEEKEVLDRAKITN